VRQLTKIWKSKFNDNGSGQRLPESLHPTQAASVNPLHPNCYAVELTSATLETMITLT
jgi:hypothetical protein